VVLDVRGTVKAASIADGSSLARFDIARGKAKGALAFNTGTRELEKLASGNVLVMGGESRLCFHGIDRIMPGTSTLLKDGGRINLTMRRVSG
jgi:uncharacterized protein GlcG (DUF336 family)